MKAGKLVSIRGVELSSVKSVEIWRTWKKV